MPNQIDNEYWATYTAIQAAKHGLLKCYLGGWFPILATYNGRVLYIDCHAGKGRHAGGEAGSPMIALSTLVNHRFKESILRHCEVCFTFMELNHEHITDLQSELASVGRLPSNVSADVIDENYETVIENALAGLTEKGEKLAPSFFFVDPYGFTLRMSLMKKILEQPRAELLITFMVRYIDMAIANPALETNMDLLFGTQDWR